MTTTDLTPQAQAFLTQQTELRKAEISAAIVQALHGSAVDGYGPGITIQAVFVAEETILVSDGDNEVRADVDVILSNNKSRQIQFHAIGSKWEFFGRGWSDLDRQQARITNNRGNHEEVHRNSEQPRPSGQRQKQRDCVSHCS